MSSNLSTGRDTLFARTGEKVTDESLFQAPDSVPHVSAFRGPPEQTEQPQNEPAINKKGPEEPTDATLLSIGDSLNTLRKTAHSAFKKSHKAVKRSHKAVKKSAYTLGPSRRNSTREPAWVRAEDGLTFVHHNDADILRLVLKIANEDYSGGQLYFRKIHVGDYGEFINWQALTQNITVEHRTRGCQDQATTLKDAARKVKSYLDFKEPSESDARFRRLYEILQNDTRYAGALLLFKEGTGKDFYPWKVRVQHERLGFTKVSNALAEAIHAMEEHLEYEEATPETQEGLIWERIFQALEKYPRCQVFFKALTENGPDGEPEKIWIMKVDHPVKGIQFEAKSRIFQEAAGQVYDYLLENSKSNAMNAKA
ncbi:uncharacterized protein FOMMEDRAFT_161312 [Fomitiporia mediterranea MF3/22]|uniref:uncharacterized protein n=1 Tax=Fomitiporia mediterranea (strain MF3/22) TaxID=694068 RepID=UPI0004409BEB|nr:uncharacterized protein FOMMEDRAFT_161312 [Fomitiporia mediterranea MF3/22]EJC99080.1 hypothetical protein FOMMEDRAFT_161312 [Fomitiporia mediterranea MF3/22]